MTPVVPALSALTSDPIAPARRRTSAPYLLLHEAEDQLLERELPQFQRVRLLGRGSAGSVFLVRDLALHRHVAVKLLHPALRDDAEACERFRREARLSARLAHPNIVPLYAFGETPRTMYMVMRYVHGESLGERLRRNGALSVQSTTRTLLQVARALEYAHGEGIVHRDLKPENVLLEREALSHRPWAQEGVVAERALLADFGVATLRSNDPRPADLRRAFGTPHFMSPEQSAGESDLDGRSDLYALGVLGYLMLTGSVPFDGASATEILAKHLAAPLPPLLERARRVPKRLAAALERCLAKDPEARWTSVHHFVVASGLDAPRGWRAWAPGLGQSIFAR